MTPTKKVVTIRFLRPWRGRQIGQIDRVLSPGVALTLVQRNVAELVQGDQEEKRPRGRPRKYTTESFHSPEV